MNPCPKPRPHALDKRDEAADLAAEDRRQRAICKQRSGGICEVVTLGGYADRVGFRCRGRAVHNHHLISGIGQRNAGRSILAAHRLDTCEACHKDIHAHVLVPVGESREYATNVVFERRS